MVDIDANDSIHLLLGNYIAIYVPKNYLSLKYNKLNIFTIDTILSSLEIWVKAHQRGAPFTVLPH